MCTELFQFQRIHPCMFVEIQQHLQSTHKSIDDNCMQNNLLFELMSSIVDRNRIVMSIQSMNQCLNRWFLQMSEIRCRLSRFLIKCDRLRIDGSKRIDDNLELLHLTSTVTDYTNILCLSPIESDRQRRRLHDH